MPTLRRSQVEFRQALVFAAKLRKCRGGGDLDLTPTELDAILPPIDCRRSRDRLARTSPARGASPPRPESLDP